MRAIGFNFDKISVEKLKDRPNDLKINTTIDISEIKELKADILKTKEQILGVKFTYGVNYEPGFAKLDLKGNIVVSVEEKQAKEVLKEWKKKKMPEDFRIIIFNFILKKTAVKAMELEDEMNLPLHLPLPTVRGQNEK